MVRITKLTDYGMIIMAFMANRPADRYQAREIAEKTTIALPTVSKLLKKLAKSKWLNSNRGMNGGYSLACMPENITVADIVEALEGPIAITECSLGHDYCPTETLCNIRAPWLQINQAITETLQAITLSSFIETQNFIEPSNFIGSQNITETPKISNSNLASNTYPLRLLERGQKHGH